MRQLDRLNLLRRLRPTTEAPVHHIAITTSSSSTSATSRLRPRPASPKHLHCIPCSSGEFIMSLPALRHHVPLILIYLFIHLIPCLDHCRQRFSPSLPSQAAALRRPFPVTPVVLHLHCIHFIHPCAAFYTMLPLFSPELHRNYLATVADPPPPRARHRPALSTFGLRVCVTNFASVSSSCFAPSSPQPCPPFLATVSSQCAADTVVPRRRFVLCGSHLGDTCAPR